MLMRMGQGLKILRVESGGKGLSEEDLKVNEKSELREKRT